MALFKSYAVIYLAIGAAMYSGGSRGGSWGAMEPPFLAS